MLCLSVGTRLCYLGKNCAQRGRILGTILDRLAFLKAMAFTIKEQEGTFKQQRSAVTGCTFIRVRRRIRVPHPKHKRNELAGDQMYNMLGIKDWARGFGKGRQRLIMAVVTLAIILHWEGISR